MPHQCLNCGDTFAEGSTDLLEGCPSCEGTRFFYTEEALEADEREELREQTDDDVEEVLEDLVEAEETPDLAEDIWSREAWEEWIKLKASGEDAPDLDLADGDDVAFETAAEPPAPEAAEPADGEAAGAREADPVQIELGDVEETSPPDAEAEPPEPSTGPARGDLEPPPAPDDDGQPSTLNINDPGEYEIDVRRLLEDSPVIVERDGSYVIHLPSVFEREE